jgi:O86/O127-antigen biosynthesis beta-1,3-galactosyltransferase
MKYPEISIILCVNNGENYISRTIESILSQTYYDFELLIILNCSSDNTENIISKFKDERIHVYKTNIEQLSFNLNYGLNLARGKYIARIDADDIAVPVRLEKQIQIIENNDYDIVGSNVDCINENGEYLNQISFPETNKKIRKSIVFKSVLAHPSILIKKDVLLSVSGYLGGRYAQDYDLWLRLMRNKDIQFYNIQEPLLKYRIHSEQTKGNRNAYAEVAGYFLKESFYTGNLKYILSAIIYSVKALILGK